jgi:hypothetical protein
MISVDTMTAHLAGALGVPVWTLLQKNADWRWLGQSRRQSVVSDDAPVSTGTPGRLDQRSSLAWSPP